MITAEFIDIMLETSMVLWNSFGTSEFFPTKASALSPIDRALVLNIMSKETKVDCLSTKLM